MMLYREIVENFAKLGAEIYQSDRLYETAGRDPSRPLEPGFIPIVSPPRIVTVSFYPNASEIATAEYSAAKQSFDAWGCSGDVASYERAYDDWLAILPQIPFYRDFNIPIFSALGIELSEFAWLPLVKCPLPAKSKIAENDVWHDRMLLWEQLSMLKPPVILAQGIEAYEVVRPMLEGKFSHHIVLQKIGRYGTKAFHELQDQRVIAELRATLN